MPRDWKNDPEAIRRYCTCIRNVVHRLDENGDRVAVGYQILETIPSCKLHGNRPEHDLPESL